MEVDPSPTTLVGDSEPADSKVWEQYNHHARRRDKLLLKDWGSSIDGLLLFAAIFAAVVTSFCVESRKMLEEDPQKSIQQLLVFMVAQDLNISMPAPSLSPSFAPEKWEILVNGFLFTSLSASILAAIGAVTCLQWVGEYDADLEDAATPKKRALRWHWRFRAVGKWYMRELIAALPILLYVAVSLFFIGLAIWFWHTRRHMAIIPLIGFLTWFVGYAITTLLAVFYPSAPYRTSMSRFLFRTFRFIHYYSWKFSHAITTLHRPLLSYIWGHLTSQGKPSTDQRDHWKIERASYSLVLRKESMKRYPWMPQGQHHRQWMHTHVWERWHVDQDATLRLASLAWLANSIDLSATSKDIFELVIHEINKLKEVKLKEWPTYRNDAPWSSIFNYLLDVPGTLNPSSNGHLIYSISELLGKMSTHPSLFERMVGELREELIAPLLKHLASRRPFSRRQASQRLRSLTHLFSSRQWVKMRPEVQPGGFALKVICDCLDAIGPHHDASRTAWIFTLCRMEDATPLGTWPNPEFVGVISDPFANEKYRQRAIKYYIEFVNSSLMGQPLPIEPGQEWHWQYVRNWEKGQKVSMLRILAEHLLPSIEISALGTASSIPGQVVQNQILKMLISSTLKRSFDGDVEALATIQPSDEAWTYAIAYSFGFRSNALTRPYLNVQLLPLEVLFEEMLSLDIRLFDETIIFLVKHDPGRLTTLQWQSIIKGFSAFKGSNAQDASGKSKKIALRRCATSMLNLSVEPWVDIFSSFMPEEEDVLENDITRSILKPLHDQLPHRIARARWKDVVGKAVVQRGVLIKSFRMIVNLVRMPHGAESDDQSHQSPLLKRMGQIRGILEKELGTNPCSPKTLACIRVVDDLAVHFNKARSSDLDFRDEFGKIEAMLIKGLEQVKALDQNDYVQDLDAIRRLWTLALQHLKEASQMTDEKEVVTNRYPVSDETRQYLREPVRPLTNDA